MHDNDDAGGPANALRARTIQWLFDFAAIDDIPAINPAADIGAIDRSRYERRLALLPGALSIGRFTSDFAALPPERIGERLLDEAYLGSMVRCPPEKAGEAPVDDEPEPKPVDLQDRFNRIIEVIGLQAGEVLVLSGSPAVTLMFSRWGAAVPEVRRHPGKQDLSRFGLAVIGRGQAGHKDFEPWTQLIKSAGKHHGPVMITTPSSNVSGILDYLWSQRASIKRYIDVWRRRSTE